MSPNTTILILAGLVTAFLLTLIFLPELRDWLSRVSIFTASSPPKKTVFRHQSADQSSKDVVTPREGTYASSESRAPESTNTSPSNVSVGGEKTFTFDPGRGALPDEIPHREILLSNSIYGMSDLRDVDDLTSLHNIGPARADNIREWAKEEPGNVGLDATPEESLEVSGEAVEA